MHRPASQPRTRSWRRRSTEKGSAGLASVGLAAAAFALVATAGCGEPLAHDPVDPKTASALEQELAEDAAEDLLATPSYLLNSKAAWARTTRAPNSIAVRGTWNRRNLIYLLNQGISYRMPLANVSAFLGHFGESTPTAADGEKPFLIPQNEFPFPRNVEDLRGQASCPVDPKTGAKVKCYGPGAGIEDDGGTAWKAFIKEIAWRLKTAEAHSIAGGDNSGAGDRIGWQIGNEINNGWNSFLMRRWYVRRARHSASWVPTLQGESSKPLYPSWWSHAQQNGTWWTNRRPCQIDGQCIKFTATGACQSGTWAWCTASINDDLLIPYYVEYVLAPTLEALQEFAQAAVPPTRNKIYDRFFFDLDWWSGAPPENASAPPDTVVSAKDAALIAARVADGSLQRAFEVSLGSLAGASHQDSRQWLNRLLRRTVQGQFAATLAGRPVSELVKNLSIQYLATYDFHGPRPQKRCHDGAGEPLETSEAEVPAEDPSEVSCPQVEPPPYVERSWEKALDGIYGQWVKPGDGTPGPIRGIWATEEVGNKDIVNVGRGPAVALKVFARYSRWWGRRGVSPQDWTELASSSTLGGLLAFFKAPGLQIDLEPDRGYELIHSFFHHPDGDGSEYHLVEAPSPLVFDGKDQTESYVFTDSTPGHKTRRLIVIYPKTTDRHPFTLSSVELTTAVWSGDVSAFGLADDRQSITRPGHMILVRQAEQAAGGTVQSAISNVPVTIDKQTLVDPNHPTRKVTRYSLRLGQKLDLGIAGGVPAQHVALFFLEHEPAP